MWAPLVTGKPGIIPQGAIVSQKPEVTERSRRHHSPLSTFPSSVCTGGPDTFLFRVSPFQLQWLPSGETVEPNSNTIPQASHTRDK